MLCSIRMFIIWIVTVNTRTKLSHHLLRSCTSYRRWEAITSSWQMSQVSGKTNIYSIQLYIFYFKQVLVNIKVVRGLLIISGPHLLWSYCACICYLIRICDLPVVSPCSMSNYLHHRHLRFSLRGWLCFESVLPIYANSAVFSVLMPLFCAWDS